MTIAEIVLVAFVLLAPALVAIAWREDAAVPNPWDGISEALDRLPR
jgi:hypothetical protein